MEKRGSTEVLMRRLKQQVTLLRRKEKAIANRLQKAFKSIKKLGGSYKRKAATHFKKIKTKVASKEAAVYRKVASDIKGKIQQKLIAKQKALGRGINRFEKTVATKLSRFLEKKADGLAKPVRKKRGKKKMKARRSS